MYRYAIGLLGIATVACGAPATPSPVSSPTAGSPSASSSEPTTVAGTASPAADPAPPAGGRHRPLVLRNLCGEVVTLSFADDPKATGAGRKTVAPSGTLDVPRKPDGSQTVWLISDKDEGIARVQITRGMTEIEVGRSCRTLDAHSPERKHAP